MPETIFAEHTLISEEHQFGGRLDWYGLFNGSRTLVDFKFTGGLYEEAVLEVAGYRQLLIENGNEVDEVRLVRFGRTEDEEQEDRYLSLKQLEAAREGFLSLRKLYDLKKDFALKKEAA